MLFVPNGGNDLGAVLSAGATRPGTTANYGTSITPGTGNAYGTFSQVGNDLTQDCYGVLINTNNVFATATFRVAAIQLAVDYAGTTTFATPLINDLVVSMANNYAGGGVWHYFPIFIPAGAAVGVAGRSSAATTFGVNIRYMTAPMNPSMIKRASYVDAIGATFGAGTITGTSVTPGTTAEGAWTAIGSATTKRYWWWQVGYQHSDTTMTALNYHLDIAVGDGTNFDIIYADQYVRTTGSETFENVPMITGVEKLVPAGSQLYCRIQNAGANENAGSFQVVIHGCGG